MFRIFFVAMLAAVLCCRQSFAQSRITQSINTNWEFHKGDASASAKWDRVSIPHSWNTHDVYDDEAGYYRGIGWYRKIVFIPADWKGKTVRLFFEGANQVTEVFVNGQSVGKHVGGYTAFNFNIDKYLKFGDSLSRNEISIKVDNSHNPDIAPLTADFTFFGGIYRDVYLVAANPVHFDMDNNAAPGIRVNYSGGVGAPKVTIAYTLSNTTATDKRVKVISELADAEGKIVAHTEDKMNLKAGVKINQANVHALKTSHLWSPDDPYLYRASTRIVDAKTNRVLDEEGTSVGLRTVEFSADRGCTINGLPVKLIGANRHQDFHYLGNALPDALHERDIQLLKDMGANFIRIAHYPQDPAVLEACDRLGILASVEIPIVNEITESKGFADNSLNMQREMIRQNYNHPSVIIWAYMNEVMLKPHFTRGSAEQKRYFGNIVALAKRLDSLTRSEDPSRYTMIPCHGDFNGYVGTGLAKVPQIVGWNLYPGWYGAGLENFEKFLDRHHKELPDKPLIVTEYGADADVRSHSLRPERFDKSVEYQVIYHNHYMKQMLARPFVAGAAIWNLVDFNSEARAESTPHINTKGITTDTRDPKDVYFLYQAYLLKQPFIKIGGNHWQLRSGIDETKKYQAADYQSLMWQSKPGILQQGKGVCVQTVRVYTNLLPSGSITLKNNGKMIGSQTAPDKVATFEVPFVNGINVLEVSGAEGRFDRQIVNFKMIPDSLASAKVPFTELNVSLGDRRFFSDDKLQQVWLPEQAYTKGSWGYIGGEEFKMENTGRLAFGSDKAIFNTDKGALYETQRIGLQGFKADVPDGRYRVTLHFAELQAKYQAEALVYNLSASKQEGEKSRAFDVLVNGVTLINSLSNSNYLLPQTAYSTSTIVDVRNGQGISIDFKVLKGQAILNAVEIRKVY